MSPASMWRSNAPVPLPDKNKKNNEHIYLEVINGLDKYLNVSSMNSFFFFVCHFVAEIPQISSNQTNNKQLERFVKINVRFAPRLFKLRRTHLKLLVSAKTFSTLWNDV